MLVAFLDVLFDDVRTGFRGAARRLETGGYRGFLRALHLSPKRRLRPRPRAGREPSSRYFWKTIASSRPFGKQFSIFLNRACRPRRGAFTAPLNHRAISSTQSRSPFRTLRVNLQDLPRSLSDVRAGLKRRRGLRARSLLFRFAYKSSILEWLGATMSFEARSTAARDALRFRFRGGDVFLLVSPRAPLCWTGCARRNRREGDEGRLRRGRLR